MTDNPTHHTVCPSCKLHRFYRLAMTFIMGVLGGTLVTTEKAAASCVGETLDLIDPVVTVISGPGDPAAEEALWLTFDYLQLVGPNEFHIDGLLGLLREPS